eukprot:jgi/Tetstr1/458182/TSEL_044673.t1
MRAAMQLGAVLPPPVARQNAPCAAAAARRRAAASAQRAAANSDTRLSQDATLLFGVGLSWAARPCLRIAQRRSAAVVCSAAGQTSSPATSTSSATATAVPEQHAEPNEAELLRRKRISEANRGKQPWNKGRKHSEATKAKIRQRTKEAMQRPEVLEKLRNMPHPKHNTQIRNKISASLRAHYIAKRPSAEERQAAAAKRAAERVRKKAAKAATAAAEKAAADARKAEEKAEKARARAEVKATPKPRKRSEEHNRKIAEAIKRKWEDPTYRGKIVSKINEEEVQSRRTAKFLETVGERQYERDYEKDVERKHAYVTEKRAYMKATAKALVTKAEDTVVKLEQKVETLRPQPALQMRAQTALGNARGVLKKARVQLAQIEMEIAMAAEDDGNLAEDSADSSDDMRAGDVGEGVVAELAPRGTNGAKINGARSVSLPRALPSSMEFDGRASQLNGHRKALNGHARSSANGVPSQRTGTARVDESKVEASVRNLRLRKDSNQQ